MSHDAVSEWARLQKAAVEQGIQSLLPGQSLKIDLTNSDEYVHLGGVGVNVIAVEVQRPEAAK